MATRRRSILTSKENLTPGPVSTGKTGASRQIVQARPRQVGDKIAASPMKEQWDGQGTADLLQRASRESPTLAQLRKRTEDSCEEGRPPSGVVYATQRVLERKHHEAKSRLEGVSGVGGGVSMWPAMDDMRLSRSDALQLACLSLVLVGTTGLVFWMYHGQSASPPPQPERSYSRLSHCRCARCEAERVQYSAEAVSS